jgi:hypothetical protein
MSSFNLKPRPFQMYGLPHGASSIRDASFFQQQNMNQRQFELSKLHGGKKHKKTQSKSFKSFKSFKSSKSLSRKSTRATNKSTMRDFLIQSFQTLNTLPKSSVVYSAPSYYISPTSLNSLPKSSSSSKSSKLSKHTRKHKSPSKPNAKSKLNKTLRRNNNNRNRVRRVRAYTGGNPNTYHGGSGGIVVPSFPASLNVSPDNPTSLSIQANQTTLQAVANSQGDCWATNSCPPEMI